LPRTTEETQEEHGEVCPANWNEGAKTIKPDVKASREYFSNIDANAATNGATKKRPRVE